MKVWYDGDAGMRRVDTYGGVDSTITTSEAEYDVYPRINVTVCEVYKGNALWGDASLGAVRVL